MKRESGGVRDESAARQLFDELRQADGWTLVEAWKRDKEFETNHLEFKRKTTPSVPTIEHADDDLIAKSLSALANTGGGLLVIGVHAGAGKKKGADYDRVEFIEAVADVDAFGGLLERQLRSFTDPEIRGLDVASVKKTGSSDGVLAIFVPRSDAGPHRTARRSSEVKDRYFMRTASGSQTMPHSTLEAAFSRGAPATLRLEARLVPASAAELVVGGRVSLELRLRNGGRGAALRPAVLFDTGTVRVVDWHLNSQLNSGFVARNVARPGEPARVLFEPTGDMVVYPGLDRGLAHVEAVLPGLNHDSVIPTFELPLRGTLFAVGTRPSPFRGHLVATQGENVDAVRSRIVSLPTEPLSFDCALVGAATGSGSVLTLRPLDLSSREACRLSDRARLHPMVLTSLLGDPDREMFKRTLTETLSRWLDGAAVDVNLTEWLDDCPQPWVLNVEGVDA